MFDRLAARWPPMIMNVSARTRRCLIGVAIVTSLLVIGVHHSIHPAAPRSGLLGCASLSSRNQVTAGDYPKIRVQFARSRWPDLRTAGTAYIDLAVHLQKAQGTDGYQAVWLYQRLSAACARHGRPLSATSSQSAPRTASALHQGAGPRPRLMTPRAAITIGGIAAPWGPTIDPLPERRPLR